MTVEPAFTRANRINSDSLDWSYIGISVTVGYERAAASRRSTAHSPSTPNRWPQTASGFAVRSEAMDLGPAAGLLKTKARIARKHGSWIAVTNAANEVRPNPRA